MAFLNRPNRLSRHAVEYENEAFLGYLRDGFDALAVYIDVAENGRGR